MSRDTNINGETRTPHPAHIKFRRTTRLGAVGLGVGALVAGMTAGISPASAATPTACSATAMTANSWSELLADFATAIPSQCVIVALGQSITMAPSTDAALAVPVGASVTLDLASFTLTANPQAGSSESPAGIGVPSSSTLVVEDTGTGGVLNATGAPGNTGGGSGGAGIGGYGVGGGSNGIPGGTAVITGGTVNATGGAGNSPTSGIGGGGGGAGIGGSGGGGGTEADEGGDGGAVTITGGTVTATGAGGGAYNGNFSGGSGAGIGGGGAGNGGLNGGNGTGGNGGAVTVTSNTTAKGADSSGNGGGSGAGIGGGGGTTNGGTGGTATYIGSPSVTNGSGPTGGLAGLAATVTTATVPGAPTSTSATAGPGTVTLSWTAPSDGGSPITGYNIYQGTTSGGESTTPVSGSPFAADAGSETISGLTAGTTYYFTMTAVNAAGTSVASSEVNATPTLAAPGTPSIASATAGDGQATVTVTAPETGGAPASYTVTSTPDRKTCTIDATADPLSCVVSGLTDGTAYTFTATATNTTGTSSASTASSSITPTPASSGNPGPGNTGSGNGSGPGSGPVSSPVAAGGTVSSSTYTTPTSSVPTIMSVTSPNAGTVTITPVSTYGFTVSAPTATAADPLRLTFATYDPALQAPPTLYRNGVAVPNCTVPDGTSASPDPCITLTHLANGTAAVTVLTSHASVWTFGQQAACTAAPFTDVAVSNEFCQPISWLKAQKITNGFADGGFHPTAPITRQAMAAFLYRAENPGKTPVACTTAPYPDVAVSSTFCGDITWLKAQKITNGFADGGFHPTAPITRQAMAAFLYRADAD